MTDTQSKTQPITTTTTYVVYLRHGVTPTEESTQRVRTRSPLQHAQCATDTAFAFYYFDVLTAIINVDGEDVEFESTKRHNTSRMYYIDGKLYGRRGVDLIAGSPEKLRFEYHHNGQALQVLCRMGGLMHFDPEVDELIATR